MSPPVPPEAITAAARALHADRCVSESCRQSGHAADQLLASVHMTGDQSADLHIARVVLEAAAPHIAAAWTRIEPDPEAPGYNRGVFDVSGFAAEVLAPAERERIRAEGAAAERERIRQSPDLSLVLGFARSTGGKPRAVREALSRLDADLLEGTP